MKIEELSNILPQLSIEEALALLVEKFPKKVVFSTSFGMEDQIITDYIFKNNLPIDIMSLPTMR